jgi:anti-sigma factor RsiW
MNSCPEREETLWLDVLGELSAEAALGWQAHLQQCQGCRREREIAQQDMEHVSTAAAAPLLTSDQRRDITTAVAAGLKRNRFTFCRGLLLTGGMGRSWSTAVAVSIALVLFAWIGYHAFYQSPKTADRQLFTAVSPQIEEMHLVEDLELISNLELLEEISTLQKLVQLEEEQALSPPSNQQSRQLRLKTRNNVRYT